MTIKLRAIMARDRRVHDRANTREWAFPRNLRGRPISAISLVLMLLFPPVSLGQHRGGEQLAQSVLSETPASDQLAAGEAMSLPWLELILRGGWLMVPIGVMSVMVVALGIERAIALRRARVAPLGLTTRLRGMAANDAFDFGAVGDHCRSNPSSLGRVVQAMLTRSGRSASEIEHAMHEACQREADEMYGPVRTINLAISVTPLLGLLGTVLGMIQAFFATANLVVGADRSQALAEGIYVALVTTFAGLSVAIPAAVIAHLFESKIVRQLREVEQIATALLPQVEGLSGNGDAARPRLGLAIPTGNLAEHAMQSKAS